MSPKISMVGVRPAAIILAILCGLVGLVVMFVAGSWSGSGDYAILAACTLFLFGNTWLAKRFPSGNFLYGLLINIPAWLFFIVLADPGQFRSAITGLVACLVAAYLGMFLGVKMSVISPGASKLIFSISLPVVIIGLVVLFFEVQGPKPIPIDKSEFIGQWRSASGFELQIRFDGTCSIIHNWRGAPNLNIDVGPDIIEGANAHFEGDSILNIGIPGLYARTYKIYRYPYRDSAGYAIILNGTLLVGQ